MPILDSPPTAKSEPWRRQLLLRGSVCLAFAFGLLITFGLWYSAERGFQRDTQAYFDFRVRQLLERIDKRLENYRQVLYGTRGLFAASEKVERAEFQQYVAAMKLDQRYPGVQGVGYAVVIPKAAKDSHIQAIRGEGFPDYRIYPDDERDVYTSIIYLEPFAGRNLNAFGYDMFSEPVRHQAMVYARDHDAVGLSGKVTLMQESGEDIQAGFLMYLPVYRNGVSPGEEWQRRAELVGWVYAPFRIKDFMAGVGGERAGDLSLSIYDGEQVSEANLMYRDNAVPVTDAAISTTQQLVIGGHVWTLVIYSEPGLKNWLKHELPLIIVISGITMSFLLAFSIRQLNARGEALALAAMTNQELRESETRFRLMADSTPVLIWVLDANQWAIWFNKHWLEYTGRSLFQEVGRGWLESVYPNHVELVVKLLDWHFQLRKSFSVEYKLRRHDGEYRWVIDTGAPRFDEHGDFMGYIGSCVDITEHKEMEEELWELATTDGLTGFLNRRHFLVRLQEEFDRMQRNAEMQSSVLMLDLDHFKRVNDNYGHAAGDAVLKHFAEIIGSEQRKIDVIGRVGGEEFAMILPDTDLSDASVFAERLRKAVAEKPLQYQCNIIDVTVSIGIALLSSATASPDSVLRDADRALYAAKGNGRNQVSLCQSDRCGPEDG